MESPWSRTEMLLGKKGIEKLSRARVAVFGIGGVGGYVCEALARTGIGKIDLFDADIVSESNLNRQIIATVKTIGKLKVDVMKERLLEINPNIEVRTYPIFFSEKNQNEYDFNDCTYIVDAIDTVRSKITLILKAQNEGINIISSMGTGNKLDPTKLEVADIYKTEVCPLAKKMRKELKQNGVKKLKVVYSKEEPIKTEERIPGSIMTVPATAGLIIAGEVIKEIINNT